MSKIICYKKVKSILTLLLVIVLSFNVFAATADENSGSSFISKAEFDTLKSNFQSQIDSYNASIDTKIDNAIASYLKSILTVREQDI